MALHVQQCIEIERQIGRSKQKIRVVDSSKQKSGRKNGFVEQNKRLRVDMSESVGVLSATKGKTILNASSVYHRPRRVHLRRHGDDACWPPGP